MEIKSNSLTKSQIDSLFDQAYTANIAIFAVGLLIVGAFLYSGEEHNLFLFFITLTLSLIARVAITYFAIKNNDQNLGAYARYYVALSLVTGLAFSIFNVSHYDLYNYELRSLLTILSFAMVTAAVGSLAVWMKSYIAFSLPQVLSLFIVFILNESYFVAVTVIIFTVFMLKIAINFNTKFIEGQNLIQENLLLVSIMKTEIDSRKHAQNKLEIHKGELELLVKERTVELEEINFNLNNQITIREDVEKKLEYIAYNDELTELPNRTLFIDKVKTSLKKSKRDKTLLGILFIDLDRLKNINDSHGRQVGDKLLKAVANRLTHILRDSDVIARNGGDEFSILIENMKDVREPYVVANKVIKALNEMFTIAEHNIHIGASVGISMFPLDGNEASELLEMADTAMYEAKKLGRNNFQFYSSSMSDQITDRLRLEGALRTALDNNEFYLVYQPQVNSITNETTGFEALIRWNSPIFGVISPFKFIPILEETGLIYSVGEWVILDVINFIKEGKSNNKKVSINLSALQCGVENYSTKIRGFIEQANIDPQLVEFEITETLLIRDFNLTEMFLNDIHEIGCTVALDDFGTGYTSFSYLTKLPIDVIKIDRSLITDIHINKNLQDIVRAIVTMSESLNIQNVFEGVETMNELEMVKQLNGVTIQGYLYSKPLEEHQISEWLKKLEKGTSIHG